MCAVKRKEEQNSSSRGERSDYFHFRMLKSVLSRGRRSKVAVEEKDQISFVSGSALIQDLLLIERLIVECQDHLQLVVQPAGSKIEPAQRAIYLAVHLPFDKTEDNNRRRSTLCA